MPAVPDHKFLIALFVATSALGGRDLPSVAEFAKAPEDETAAALERLISLGLATKAEGHAWWELDPDSTRTTVLYTLTPAGRAELDF